MRKSTFLVGLVFTSLLMVLIVDAYKLKHPLKTKEMREHKQKKDGTYFPNVLETPLRCYHCHNAKTHEECNEQGLIECAYSQDSCQTEVRMMHVGRGLVPRITKGCKQTTACNNNYMQNDRPGWPSTQCNQAEYFPLYVCRYCCGEAGCNSNTDEPHCRKLEAPTNGWMNCMPVPGVTSSACEFGCDKCFKLEGSKSRTCKSNKYWSGDDAKCVFDPDCKLDHCSTEMTTPMEHGEVVCSMGRSAGSICEFSCEEGYHVLGRKSVQCVEETLEWDAVKPACKEGDTKTNPCNEFATFEYDRNGTLICKCRPGFEGDGLTSCLDIDECASPDLNKCHELATCTNTIGSYLCNCEAGFSGDGFECYDINECMTWQHDCDANGICKNNVGSYTCMCAPEYIGDGINCEKNDVDCPHEQLMDGLYCIRKNITQKPKPTEVIQIATTGNSIEIIGGATRAIDATAPTSTDPSGKSGKSIDTTTISDATNALNDATTKSVTDTNSNLATAENGNTSGATPTVPNTITDVVPTDINSNNNDTSSVATNIPGEGSEVTPSTTSDAPVDATTTVTPPEPQIDWCVSFEQGVPPVMKDERVYKEINDLLLSRVVPAGDETSVILGAWIGLDDRFDGNELRWRDGCELKEGQFTKWAPGEPRLRKEEDFQNCVHLISDPVSYGTRDFLWKVVNCSDSLRYSCDTERAKHSGNDLEICKPRIGDIANGAVTCTDGWNVNSVCSFECDPGFVLQESYSQTMCLGTTLTWSRTPPTCVRAVCSPPLFPPNEGNMTCSDDNNIGSVCEFGCNRGYRIQGNAEVTCLENQEWSSSRPCCRDDCAPYARMNLIFVLDSSSSVGLENFYDIKQFVKDLQKRFVLSVDFTQVTAIVYHSKIVPLNNNEIFDSNVEFEEAIGKLTYSGLGTYTGKAIEYVIENFIGRRDGAKDVVVLLTDGKSLDDVTEPAKKLRQLNVHVVAVGVKEARWSELEAIASKPISENIVTVDKFVDLEKTVQNIEKKVCSSQC
ncbi:uncharacterized protein LOC120338298 [Styela clava]